MEMERRVTLTFWEACFGALDYDKPFGQKTLIVRHFYRLYRIICATGKWCLIILNYFEPQTGRLQKGYKNVCPGH